MGEVIMESLFLGRKEFKQIYLNPNYFIDQDGNVYSQFAKKIIKHSYRKRGNKTYPYICIYFNGKQRKYAIHRLVYHTWVQPLREGEQVNHKDDNELNCNYKNLYVGTQKDNIQDCMFNNHRVGHVYYLTLFDRELGKVISFCPAKDFIAYSGHPNKSGSLNKFFSKNWFKKRYEIIEFKRIGNIDELKGVTTKADECKPVE